LSEASARGKFASSFKVMRQAEMRFMGGCEALEVCASISQSMRVNHLGSRLKRMMLFPMRNCASFCSMAARTRSSS